jgi:predicted LPLAT superfamily acyltransferase
MAIEPAIVARSDSAEWLGYRERGSTALLRFMVLLSMHLGRTVSRIPLYVIALYFFLFAPSARRESRRYLRRALGRSPRARERFRHVLNFATTIHDRVYLVNERYDVFDITIEGESLMRAQVGLGHGAFLMGAHMGSFEVIGSVGRRQADLQVSMAMYEDNARKINGILAALNSKAKPDIISLGQVDAMLRIAERLDRGSFVGMLGDRTPGDEPVHEVTILGERAYLPTGPMRAAAILRRSVIFTLGLYRGGNRYHVVFAPIADFSEVTPKTRHAAVCSAVERYAALLDQYCRSDPYNWFNFFNFWRETPPKLPRGPAARSRRALTSSLIALTAISALRVTSATAAADDLDEVLRLLAARRHGEVSFVEQKFMALLKRPAESSGELVYDAPNRLEKRTLEPHPETLVLSGSELTLERNHHTRVIDLKTYPQVLPFIESIRATLAGDRAALERLFRPDFAGNLARWTLVLVPLDTAAPRHIAAVQIDGMRDTLIKVEIRETDGDRSLMTLRAHPAP